MGLVWRQRSLDRWAGFDDDGQQVGHVGLVIADGGQVRYWHGWRRNDTPTGIDLGGFPTAERARVPDLRRDLNLLDGDNPVTRVGL